jgi:hypothetical protein
VTSSAIASIVIAVSVVALLIVRQLIARRVREPTAARVVLTLGVVGVIQMVQAAKGHHVGATTVAAIAVGLVIGAGLGAARAMTLRIWRDESGVAWRQGSWLTAILWVLSLAAHFGIDALIDHSTTAKGLGTADILLYLAVSLGVQRELTRVRAARIGAGSVSRGRYANASATASRAASEGRPKAH